METELDLGTVIDPKTIKTELSIMKKEAVEAKESPAKKSAKTKAEKAKIYNFKDDASKSNSPEMQGKY